MSDFECSVCKKEIENSLENRVELKVHGKLMIPKTWGLCNSCRDRRSFVEKTRETKDENN